MSFILFLFTIFSSANSKCITNQNQTCLNFTYENKSFSDSQCIWNNYFEYSWCAIKLDEDSGDIEEYGICQVDEDQEDCYSFECNKDPHNGKFMKVLEAHADSYSTLSDSELTFEEGFHYCNSIGGHMISVQSDQDSTVALNRALAPKEFYWVGYKAIGHSIHPLQKGSINANKSSHFQHELVEEVVNEPDFSSEEEHCVAAVANTPYNFYYKPDFIALPCSHTFKVLCMKNCTSMNIPKVIGT